MHSAFIQMARVIPGLAWLVLARKRGRDMQDLLMEMTDLQTSEADVCFRCLSLKQTSEKDTVELELLSGN